MNTMVEDKIPTDDFSDQKIPPEKQCDFTFIPQIQGN
jgi:hypothetical protein